MAGPEPWSAVVDVRACRSIGSLAEPLPAALPQGNRIHTVGLPDAPARLPGQATATEQPDVNHRDRVPPGISVEPILCRCLPQADGHDAQRISRAFAGRSV